MIKKLIFKSNFFDISALISVFIFSIAGTLVSLNRFWQYEVFYYDFGIFDQAIWNVSRFNPPIIEHLVVGGKWIFADHLNPSLFLLTPLYWLTDKSEIILVAQAVAVGLSGLFIYLIGREVLKNKFWSFSILLVYFLFLGIQNAVITDFHEVTVATLPFVASYYFLIKKNYKVFFILFLITLGFKESNFLLCFGMAISVFLIDRKLWKLALLCGVIALSWGYININYIIPYFSDGIYQYNVAVQPNPVQIAGTFFDSEIKRRTLLYSFMSFGFLPLFSPQFWAIMFQDFLARFYSPVWFTRWGMDLHYSAILGATFGISSIFTFKLIDKKVKKKIILNILAVVIVLNAIYLYRFELNGPFGLAYNSAFYAHSKDFKFLDDMIKVVPKDATVLTQNNLAPRFTHQKVSLLRDMPITSTAVYYQTMIPQPDYIVIDSREGQNPNNYFVVRDMTPILDALEKDKNYKAVYKKGDQVVYKKN